MIIGTSDKGKYEIDPTRHINIIGGSGVGKTSLLEHIASNWVAEGHGIAIFDPHGDFADRFPLLVPKSRWADIIFYDPDADAPALNPLYFKDPEQLEQAKESVISILKALSGSDSAWGNATPYNVRNGLDAITENSKIVSIPTIVHLMRFMADAEYRDRHLDESKNPFVKLYQKQLSRNTDFSPAINKLAKLMRPNIINAVGNPQSIDLLDCMNQNKIIICRFSKGRLGEETAQILYSLVVSMLSIAALKREGQTSRPPFMIVADEAQNAIHGGRFGTLLAEARKYGISLVTAFQGFYQVPFMHDVLTNSATQIVFNPSGEDAEVMAKNWNWPDVFPYSLTGLPRYEFYSRTFEDNSPVVRHVYTPPQIRIKSSPRTLQKILNTSMMKYCTSREKVREGVNAFLAN